MTEDFDAVMKDPIIPILERLESDRSAHTRRELAGLCGVVLAGRSSRLLVELACSWELNETELQLMSILLMLCSDDSAEVCTEAKQVL